MNRLSLALLTLLPLCAQEKISSTRVFTEPSGARFYVDGQPYAAPASFLWPAGSKHVLAIDPVQAGFNGGSRLTFQNWADSTGLLNVPTPSIAITADPSISFIKAVVQLEYSIALNFAAGGISPGTVYVAGAPYQYDATIWQRAGTAVTLQAIPNPGFVFTGWGSAISSTQAFLQSFVLNGPMVLAPHFEPAGKITFLTSPPGLKVLADRTPLQTPVTLDWGLRTQHTIGVISPQIDNQGTLWIFDSWSQGGDQTQVFTMPAANTPQTVTAQFVPGVRASFLTDPAGLKLSIDGRDNWPSYNFEWSAGSRHTVAAPLEQVDATGRRYVFRSWSNGGAASQEIIAPASGLRMIAGYDVLGKLTVESSPPGMTVQLDGAGCRTPCTLERPLGALVKIAAPSSVMLGEDTRLDFRSWSDGGASVHSWTCVSEPQTITAVYQVSYRLRAVADPPGGASFRFKPDSADAFFPSGTQVTIIADPKPGYRFRYWDGAGVITMTGPSTVRAVLETAPFIAPAGVQNAAGDVPGQGVAAGSIISIYGANLAPGFEVGPENPLAQTIAGVTVRLGDRILPLFFVSPEQINALLPSDLEEGGYSLAVHWEQHPEVAAALVVVRNAPGLFTAVRTGETVALFGTGFGPYESRAPDGFNVPASANLRVADPVEILLGDCVLQPEWAGAAQGYTGVTLVRFRIPEDCAGVPKLEVRVRVNGRESNTLAF